jgi:hypothetical protein
VTFRRREVQPKALLEGERSPNDPVKREERRAHGRREIYG